VKRKRMYIAGSIFLFVLIGAGIYTGVMYQTHWKYVQDTDDASIQSDQITMSSKLAGYVRDVEVGDNQPVQRGALLVQLDAVDYATKVRSADAGIATAVAAHGAAIAQQAEEQSQIQQARAGIQAAASSLRYATGEVARYTPLVQSGAESPATLSQLEANRDKAAADLVAQQALLDGAKRHVATLSAQSQELAAQLDTAKVARSAAYNDLASIRMTAPVDGRIAGRSVRVGQYVQPGTKLMTVVPDTDLYVVANFKETQVGLISPGLPAKVRVDALPGVVFPGVVASITPGTGSNFSMIPPQNATGNFTKIVQRIPVRIRITPGPQARLRLVPGLSADVEIDTRPSRREIETIRAEVQNGKGRS
jgi:membrane fusion protein (multidrug efflux system)